jgi:hypothetical protein
MSNESFSPQGRDPQLWHLAQKRASFKKHFVTYLIINAFLWLLWYFTGAETYGRGIPWPVWPTFGWGIGLLFHYMGAYVTTGSDAVEKEYQKLKNNQNI